MIANNTLSQFNYDTLSLLDSHLDYIVKKHKINLNFHDIYGMYELNAEVKKLLMKYYFHDNVFCNNLKKDDECYFTCVLNKTKIAKKCEEVKGPFYGICPMGVEEYIFPIFHKNRVFGFFCVGTFCTDLDRSLYLLKKGTAKFGLDYDKAKNDFLRLKKARIANMAEFINDMNIACKLVLLLFSEYGYEFENENAITTHMTNRTVKKAIEFINNNYHKNISTRIIAEACFCNPTYLSAIFKKKMSMTVTDYVNLERVTRAKRMLDWTDESVTNVAYRVGFNDSAYFSRVYRKVFGKTPSNDRTKNRTP